MKSDLFMHEVRQTSTVFGRKTDVKVVFHGDQACTNGDMIMLPELARGVDVSDETAAVMRGYTDHEAGHIRHSNMKLLMKTYERWIGESKVLLKSLHNALEDVWLEQRVRAEYPGSEVNLRATTEAVNQGFLDRVASGEIDASDARDLMFVGPVAITWAGRKSYGGPTCEQCLDVLSPEDRARVEGWAAKVDACTSTKDTIKLAEAIYEELKAYEAARPKPEKKPEPMIKIADKGKGKGAEASEGGPTEDGLTASGEPTDVGEEKGDEGEGDEDGYEIDEDIDRPSESDEVDGDEDGDEDGAGSGDEDEGEGDASGEGDDGEGDGEGEDGCDDEGDLPDDEGGSSGTDGTGRETDATEARSGRTERVFEDFDVKSAVEKKLADDKLIGAGVTRGDGYLPFSTSHDKWHHRKLDTDLSKHLRQPDASGYDRALERMQGEVNGVRRTLERALVSKQQRDWVGGRDAGRLDARRFSAVMAGRTSVFKERTDRAELDTALTVMVDLSGSMKGAGKANVARDCVMALVEAVDRTGIAYEVVGFSNRRELPRGWTKQVNEGIARGMKYARWEPLDMVIFKAFEERLFEAKGALYNIPQFVGGENTDGEAIAMAYSRLKARSERRKVLLTLSDGAPACSSANSDALRAHLGRAITAVKRDGCSCLGVGIMDDTVARYYPEHVVVNSISDLAGKTLALLGKQLLGERVGALMAAAG